MDTVVLYKEAWGKCVRGFTEMKEVDMFPVT